MLAVMILYHSSVGSQWVWSVCEQGNRKTNEVIPLSTSPSEELIKFLHLLTPSTTRPWRVVIFLSFCKYCRRNCSVVRADSQSWFTCFDFIEQWKKKPRCPKDFAAPYLVREQIKARRKKHLIILWGQLRLVYRLFSFCRWVLRIFWHGDDQHPITSLQSRSWSTHWSYTMVNARITTDDFVDE